MAANLIAENLFTQVDQAGHQFTILDSITVTRTYDTQVLQQDSFMHTSMVTKRIVNTTKGWEIFIQWKYGSTNWNTLKNLRYLYPVHMD